ncbi:unannotated protein [freshwater metagenome]|uniref:Unannotated protein n=1 Tax=freshwater metagenome TaxID=449393 RepID=A0A6J6CYJ3_9ZZZZ
MTTPVQSLPLGAVTAAAPTIDIYAELESSAVNSVGAVNVTTIGAEFTCPAVSGPVLVTVKLVIAAALAESAFTRDKGKAIPIAKADANRNERDRGSN